MDLSCSKSQYSHYCDLCVCVCVFSLFLSILRIGLQYFDCCLKRMMIKAINEDVDLLGFSFCCSFCLRFDLAL